MLLLLSSPYRRALQLKEHPFSEIPSAISTCAASLHCQLLGNPAVNTRKVLKIHCKILEGKKQQIFLFAADKSVCTLWDTFLLFSFAHTLRLVWVLLSFTFNSSYSHPCWSHETIFPHTQCTQLTKTANKKTNGNVLSPKSSEFCFVPVTEIHISVVLLVPSNFSSAFCSSF